MNILKFGALCAALSLCACALFGFEKTLTSPDGAIVTRIKGGETPLEYAIYYKGLRVFEGAHIALATDKGVLNGALPLKNADERVHDEILKPLWGLKSEIRDNFKELELGFENYSIVFRAYDNALCYRVKANFENGFVVNEETAEFPFAEDWIAYAYPMKTYSLHFQQQFESLPVKKLSNFYSIIAPLLVYSRDGSLRAVVTDAGVYDYPTMNFNKPADARGVDGFFQKYPLEFKATKSALHPLKRADYLARFDGAKAMPWRAVIVAQDDKALLYDDTVYKLADSCALEDVSWIKTGTCAWDWWHGQNLEGVDFETGMNDATMKYHIDFAQKFGIPYMLIDGGWMKDNDDMDGSAVLDIPMLSKYAQERGVGLILWTLSRILKDREKADAFFKRLHEMGIKGVKADFTERDDAEAMAFYRDISALAAKHKLVIDWHGCPKSTGLYRTYPNIINEEGVRGAELNRMTEKLTPDHNVGLLFTRMIAGPFDYTPGAMRNRPYNANPIKDFAVSTLWPMAHGTRTHQAAMYVMFYEPLKMLCDSPTEYEKYPAFTKFIAECPTVWDDSLPLAAKFNEYAVIARRKGDVWYVGAMSDRKGKELEVKLDFLEDGAVYDAEIVCDTVNSNRLAQDYAIKRGVCKKGDVLKIKMAQGGGFAAKFSKRGV